MWCGGLPRVGGGVGVLCEAVVVVGARVLRVVEPVEELLDLVIFALLLVHVPELVVAPVDFVEGPLVLLNLLHDDSFGLGRLWREVQLDPGLQSALVVECWLAVRAVLLDPLLAQVAHLVAVWQLIVEGPGAWKGSVDARAATVPVDCVRHYTHDDGWWSKS